MTEFIQIGIGGVVLGCLYALIGVGFSLIYRVTSTVNLAQGGFCVLAALIGYSLNHSWGWPIAVSVPVAVMLTVGIGLGLGAISFVPGLKRLSNANVLMMTVGLLTMIEGFCLVVWGSQPYNPPPFSADRPLRFGPILVPTQALWVVSTAVVVVALLWLVIYRTRLGRALRACAENRNAARLMGIDVPLMTLISFGLAVLVAAVAGVVVAPTTSLQFDTGRLFTISGFIAVVAGGIASFPGAILGGLFLGVITQFATAYVSSLFSSAIALMVLMAVLVFFPDGLLGNASVRRLDVREDPRVWQHAPRLRPSLAVVLGPLALAVAVAAPWIITSEGLLSSLVIALILFIALIGLDVVMGYAGQVSLGQAGFMAIGGYTAGYLTINFALEPLLAVAAGIAISLACSLVLSFVTLRLRGLYLALATLAFGLLVDACAVGFVEITGGPSGMVGIPSFSIGPFAFESTRQMYYLVLAIVVVVLLALFGALRSGFGRALRAIRSDQMAAAALSIDVKRTKLVALAISAALASLAGSLYAFFFHFLAPDMVGTTRSFELVAMLVLGGEGTLVGAVLGSIILTMLPTLFQPLAVYKTLFSGGLMVACFLLLPEGLYGGLLRILAAAGPRRLPAVAPVAGRRAPRSSHR